MGPRVQPHGAREKTQDFEGRHIFDHFYDLNQVDLILHRTRPLAFNLNLFQIKTVHFPNDNKLDKAVRHKFLGAWDLDLFHYIFGK